ncbi:MAG: proton-conducting transporter membrane subunit, partial [Gammaproteobacteria bacterium]
MMTSLPPGVIILIGAFLIPLLPRSAQAAGALVLPIVSLTHLVFLSGPMVLEAEVLGLSLMPVRIDKLSLVFGYIFHIAAILAALYALHVRRTVEHVAAMLYLGSAIGAVFAGDLLTLFVYWEITALSSVFLIFASRTESSYRAGIRYLIIQVGSGVLLLSGILIHYQDVGSMAFGQLIGAAGDLGEASAGVWLIFLAFGIKCAFPLLHNWLQDAYPQATVTGAVFLSAFTTKLAIYALARGFPGTDALIGIGVVMTLFP